MEHSPSCTPPPPDLSSEEEEEIDLPVFGTGTSLKVQKLETPDSPTSLGTTAAASATGPPHVTSLPRAPTPPQQQEQPSQSVPREEVHRPKISIPPKQDPVKREGFQSHADFEELKNLSPLKPSGLKTRSESKKTARKVQKLSKTLKEKTEIERKLEELKSLNGIQGLVRAEEEKSAALRSASLQDEGSGSSSLTPYQQGSLASVGEFFRPSSISGDALPPSLPTRPPGRQIFIHEPSLITELYPPGIESNDGGMLSNFLLHGSEEDIKNIVCGQMLPLCYLTTPCPVELQQWLFQLMACTHDPVVSSGAYRSLIGLLQCARKLSPNAPPFSAPSVNNITDVLVSLGAEREKLRPLVIQEGAAVVPAVDCEGDEVFSPPKPPSANLIHLVGYLSACLKYLPGCYSVQDLEDLVLVLCSLSLDQFCSRFLESGLQHCIQLLLAAYPDALWHKAVQRLSPQLLCLSLHHHDRLCVAYLIGRHTQRQKYLLTDFCRRCLVKMLRLEEGGGACGGWEGDGGGEGGVGGEGGGEGSCGEGKESGMEVGDGEDTSINRDQGMGEIVSASGKKDANHASESMRAERTATQTTRAPQLSSATLALSNSAFTTRVVSSFSRKSLKEFKNEDYYRMHSLLLMLQLCTPPSELSWSNEEKKSQYVRLLSAVCSEIRDDLNWPARAPVKELLIRMRLEVRNIGSKEKQTDLFSFSS